MRKILSNFHHTNMISLMLWAVFVLSIQLTGCASIPDSKQAIHDAENKNDSLEIEAANRVLNEHAVEKKLLKLTPEAEIRASFEEHLKIEQAIVGTDLYADNNVKILFDGENTFKAMREALDAAKESINLEYFILEDVDLAGESLKSLLIRKMGEGVQVNIIYDAFGSNATPPEFFDDLKQAGANVIVYHPLQLGYLTKVNNRDHRKIMVIDGKLAIIGGINLSKTYQSMGSSGLGRSFRQKVDEENSTHWRDTDAIIQGPVVAEIQRIFVSHWQCTQPLDQAKFFPELHKEGNELVRVIPTVSKKEKVTDSPYYLALISAIQSAKRTIILNSGYFVPTKDQKQALIDASKRGVKVTLLLPSMSDSKLALNVQRSRYEDFLENGISIYEMKDEILHAKMVSIDGVWSVIGSSNFDYRSAGLNSEVDFVILGHETSQQLESRFKDDLDDSVQVDYQQWKRRPLADKIRQTVSRLFEDVL